MGSHFSKVLIPVFILLTFFSCKDKKEEFDYGYGYFPMEVGNYWVYDVIQANYVTGVPDRDTFQIKEKVTETFTVGGELRYRLERFKRDSESDLWPTVPDSVWTAYVTTSKIVRIENNNRFIKLTFPVENGKSWNGNAENSFGTDLYSLKNINSSFQVKNGNSYSGTATVMQEVDTSNIVDRDYRFEVFAKDIGMVYRSKEIYEYDQSTLGSFDIESGISYYESLNSYGKE